MGLSPREDHIDALFTKYDTGLGKGEFDYVAFLKGAVPRAIAETGSFLQTFFNDRPKVEKRMAQAPPVPPAAMEAVLREKVAARGRHGPVELRAAVRAADADGVGSLSLPQFETALRQFHLGGTKEDVSALFRSLDAASGGAGRVPVSTILSRVLPADFPDPREQAKERIANRVAADAESLRDALLAAERRAGSGPRGLPAAKAAEIAEPRLRAAGLTGEALMAMAESCVAADSGRFDIDMFTRAVSRVVTSRASSAITDDRGGVGLLQQLQQTSYAAPGGPGAGNAGPGAPRFPTAKDLKGLKEAIRSSIAARCKARVWASRFAGSAVSSAPAASPSNATHTVRTIPASTRSGCLLTHALPPLPLPQPGMREMRLASQYFDAKRTGVASAEELAAALGRLNMRLRPEEMDLLLRRYGSHQAGVIRVENLLRDVFPAEWGAADAPGAAGPGAGPQPEVPSGDLAVKVSGALAGGKAQSVSLDELRNVCKARFGVVVCAA